MQPVAYDDNEEINKFISVFVKKIIYNVYTGEMWEAEAINDYDRLELARELAGEYFSDYRLKAEGYDSIGGKENMSNFLEYVAKKIDRLIPRLYFMEENRDFSERYSSLLTKRIFTTYGKNAYRATADLIYVYKHDFSQEEQYIKDTASTNKQIVYLNSLAKEQGFQLVNSEYLSRIDANSLIEYFKGTLENEPKVFTFFLVEV